MTLRIEKVSAGSTTVLPCKSNDNYTNFLFWLLQNNEIIGPGNDFDESKLKFLVLSGNLSIHNVGPEHAGVYKCFSQSINNSARYVEDVELVVTGSHNIIEAIKLVAIVVSIIVIIGCAVIYMRLKKDWDKYDGRTIVPVDEDDDADDADEVYNPTTTTISAPHVAPVAGPSRNPSSEHLLYGIDNQGLDTDFNSVFENIQIKTTQHQSLI